MGYIESSLIPGERIVYLARLHWIVFLWSVIFLILALVGFASGYESIGLVFLLIGVFKGIFSLLDYLTSEFGLTNMRILFKIGWIRRRTFEMFLTKVEGIGVEQGIIGRILDYGTIVVIGAGGTREMFHKINAPLEFRRKAQEQIANVQELK
jgi:uncharacterized membrane protein YdbT with pleckstrin-like domain